MASHNINISVVNNETGIVPTSDGIMMLFCWGVATGAIAYNTLYQLTSLEQAQAMGITQAYDEANGTALWQHCNEFYDGGLNDGLILWLVVLPVGTTYTSYVTTSTFTGLVQQTAAANPANRAKMIGFAYNAPQTVNTGANPFLADVITAIPAIQAAQIAMFKNYFQWSAILDGNNMNVNLTPTSLPGLTTFSAGTVSLCITGTQPNGVSGIGLALGRFAQISVGHGFGAVADGPVTTPTAYLTNGVLIGEGIISGTGGVLQVGVTYLVLNAPVTYNGTVYQVGSTFTAVGGQTSFTTSAPGGYVTNVTVTPVSSLTQGPNGQITALGNSQYLFLCTVPGESGYYWNDGATCISVAFAESSQEYARVANALSADALIFFTQFRGSTLPSLAQTGAISPAWVGNQQAAFAQQYIDPLVNNGDIVAASIAITGPTYNATGQLGFVLTIVRSTILGNVTGIVTFSATI